MTEQIIINNDLILHGYFNLHGNGMKAGTMVTALHKDLIRIGIEIYSPNFMNGPYFIHAFAHIFDYHYDYVTEISFENLKSLFPDIKLPEQLEYKNFMQSLKIAKQLGES